MIKKIRIFFQKRRNLARLKSATNKFGATVVQILKWEPKTCGCVFEEYKDNLGQNVGTAVLEKCNAHLSVLDNDLYNVIYQNSDSEQKRIALALRKIKASPDSYYVLSAQEQNLLKIFLRLGIQDDSEIPPEKIPNKIFHPDKGIKFSFDSNRKLNVEMPGYSLAEKLAIKNDIIAELNKDSIEIL